MKITETRIPDVKLIEPKVFGDERGLFMETWNDRAFREAGINATFVQDNHSRPVKNTLRELHYQIKQPQGKLVRVTSGGANVESSSPPPPESLRVPAGSAIHANWLFTSFSG